MKRAKHNLSYYNLATMEMGKLVPVGLTEVLPVDGIQHHANVVVRVSPMAAPIMHHITCRLHHFYIPHRLVWDGWEDFITGGPNGDNADTVPTIETPPLQQARNSILDYMGVPPDTGVGYPVNRMPVNCYNLIFNEFYRDQDLVPERELDDITLANIAWEKDYFTTARPWTQKGPEVTIPIADRAPIYSTDFVQNGGKAGPAVDAANVPGLPGLWPDDPTAGDAIYADLSAADAVPVNDFRKAFALQRYQEARSRYGSRYVEYLKYLGVRSNIDARLQRPEFLGGGTAQVQVSEVLQTANDASDSKEFGVGDMYGHGIAAMRSNAYRRTIEEHGYIMTLMSVRPKAVYSQFMDRHWLRQHKEDYFQRELQHIGQQPIWEGEVWPSNDDVETRYNDWGYQDRYAEYRQNFSKVSAEYRNLLNYWHMAREFENKPVLNQSFIDCIPTKRIHNEQTQHALWCAIQHKMVARRLVDRSAVARIY